MTILVIALVSLAQLFAVSTQANARARATTYAAILAAQKMEQLRALTYEIDAAGLPITDTTSDVTTGPAAPAGGRGLSPSPPTSLDANTDGYCDFVDANGRVLGGGAEPPPAAMYVRRWAIAPLAADPANTIVLQVIVTGVRDRVADDARIMSVKTRKAA